MDNFAEWLQSELDHRGWSQSELARRGNISQSAISSTLTGRSRPGEKVCLAIARAFNMAPAEVLSRAGIETPQRESAKTRLLSHYAELLDPETLDHILAIVRELSRGQ